MLANLKNEGQIVGGLVRLANILQMKNIFIEKPTQATVYSAITTTLAGRRAIHYAHGGSLFKNASF